MDEVIEDLDMLTQMIKVAFTLSGWEKMIELADPLNFVCFRGTATRIHTQS